MTSLLEERYRRALRMLPASYRAAWGEDMVATFMERAYAATPDDPEGVELGTPSRAELASVARLAVRLWLGGVGAAPRYFAWGEAMRRIALVGLLANAIGATVSIAVLIWITRRYPGLPELAYDVPIDRWQLTLRIVDALWLPAYLALLYGRSSLARVLAWAALLPFVINTVGVSMGGHGPVGFSTVYVFAFYALPAVALAAFHESAPPFNRRPWWIALPAGAVITLGLVLLARPASPVGFVTDWPGLWCVAVTAAAAGLLIRSRFGRRQEAPVVPWILALAVLGFAALGLRVTTLAYYQASAALAPEWSWVAAVDIAEAVAILLASTTMAVLAVRAVRRLPTAPPTSG